MTYRDLNSQEKKQFLQDFEALNPLSFSSLAHWEDFFLTCGVRDVGRGEFLYEEGQNAGKAYVVFRGCLEVSKSTDEDQQKVLSFLRSGNWLGIPELFGMVYHVTVQALEPTKVLQFSQEALVSAGQKNPVLLMDLLKFVSRLVGDYQDSLVLRRAETKVFHYLRWLSQKQSGKEFLIHHTHEEIAQMLSLSRETVSKTLSHFLKSGVIKSLGKDRFQVMEDHLFQPLSDDSGLVGFYGSDMKKKGDS